MSQRSGLSRLARRGRRRCRSCSGGLARRLVAVRARRASRRLVALHEFWLLARPLRPLAPAGYVGGVLALLGAAVAASTWMLGGLLATLALAFLLKGISRDARGGDRVDLRDRAGAAWIGFGLGFCCSCATSPTTAGSRVHRAARRVGGRHVRLLRRPAARPAQAGAGALARARRGRASSSAPRRRSSSPSSRSTRRHTSCRSGRRSCSGVVVAVAAPVGDLFESMLKRDMRA